VTRRDLDAAHQILWDFISGHWMHLHLVDIYRHNQNVIAVVAIRSNIILDRQYLFAPRIEPSAFFSGKIWYIVAKSIPFLLCLNYVLKTYLQKEKTDRAIFYRDSRLSAQSPDKRLLNKTCTACSRTATFPPTNSINLKPGYPSHLKISPDQISYQL
jgi:hypothetical protein